MKEIVSLPLAMACVALGGCGGTASTTSSPSGSTQATTAAAPPAAETQVVARTVRNYFIDLLDGDGPGACKALSPAWQRAFARQLNVAACPAAVAKVISAFVQNGYPVGSAARKRIAVGQVTVSGQRAQAVVAYTKSGQTLHIPYVLEKRMRRWQIVRVDSAY